MDFWVQGLPNEKCENEKKTVNNAVKSKDAKITQNLILLDSTLIFRRYGDG